MTDEHVSVHTLIRLAVARGVLLASPLMAFQNDEHVDDPALAVRLECSQGDLLQLRLCEIPRREHFEEDVDRIAEHVHASKGTLAHLLKQIIIR